MFPDLFLLNMSAGQTMQITCSCEQIYQRTSMHFDTSTKAVKVENTSCISALYGIGIVLIFCLHSWHHYALDVFDSNPDRRSGFQFLRYRLPYGLVVRIPGFHPGGPGAIPGVGICVFFFPFLLFLFFLHFFLRPERHGNIKEKPNKQTKKKTKNKNTPDESVWTKSLIVSKSRTFGSTCLGDLDLVPWYRLPYGLVVRIPGFHPGGPGSIPGVGSNCSSIFLVGVLGFYVFSF